MTQTKTQQAGCTSGLLRREHFGALVAQTFRVIRRALDARIAADVTPELTGVRGMLLGEIVGPTRKTGTFTSGMWSTGCRSGAPA